MFKPGTSGNPGGRPKGVAEVRGLAQNLTAQAFEEIERIAFASPDDRARLAAIAIILDRAYGKAPQTVDAMVQGQLSLIIETGVPRAVSRRIRGVGQ